MDKKLLESVIVPEGALYCAGFGHYKIKSVSRLNSRQTIEKHAFSFRESLESITIPKIKKIGDSAFSHCKNLKTLKFEKGPTQIGDSAVSETGIETLTLPARLESIGFGAFADCPNLNRI